MIYRIRMAWLVLIGKRTVYTLVFPHSSTSATGVNSFIWSQKP
jgi:hypothetical protein